MRTQGVSLFAFLLSASLLLGLAAPLPVGAAPAVLTSVTGTVRDGTFGGHTYPLYARIVFTSPSLTPLTVFTDPFSGVYHAALVQNELTTAAITPILPGYLPRQVSFTPNTDPFTSNFTVLADLTACNAPGYTNSKVFLETFKSAVPPALPGLWSVVKYGSLTGTWTSASVSLHPTGIEPFSGLNMAVFKSSTATALDATLLYTTGSTSLTGLTNAVLSFWMYHDSGSPGKQDRVQAAISTNGTNFILLGAAIPRYSATPGWAFHSVNISTYAGPGKPSVYLALKATSAAGSDIYIGDIAIGAATCLKSPGGLVAGMVRSAASGRPVISALVTNADRTAERAYTQSRGADPALRDGLYQLFSTVSGPQTFTAAAIRHQAAGQTVTVAEDGVTRLDLALPSAYVTANPDHLALTLAVGGAASLPLTLSNTGPLPASFTLQSAASLLSSGSTLSGPVPYREEPASGPTLGWSEALAGGGPPAPPAAPASALEPQVGAPRSFGVTTPFPGLAGYRSAAASCDGEAFYVFGGQYGGTAVNEVWLYDPANHLWSPRAPMPVAAANMRAACIDGKIYLVGGFGGTAWKNIFQVYDTRANTWTSSTQPFTGGPMLASYKGLLYSLGGASSAGPSSQARVYNPTTDSWSDLAPLPTPTEYAGIVVYRDKIFILGGSDTADVQVYTPATNTWNNAGPDLPGARMDPVVGWYGDYIYLLGGGGSGGDYWQPFLDSYRLDASTWPAGSWSSLGLTLPKPRVAPAYVCANNRLWSVGGTVDRYEADTTQAYDGGLMCNRTYGGAPWLTPAPVSGSIPAGGSLPVTLAVSAASTPYNAPGVYHAALKLNTDAPMIVPDIPVTLVVAQTSGYLSLTPQSATNLVRPGGYVSCTVTVTNKTGEKESFSFYTIEITPGWTTAISGGDSLANIPNNGSAVLTLKLSPPEAANDGDEGVLTLGVKVHDTPDRFVTFSAIATIQHYLSWTPYVAK